MQVGWANYDLKRAYRQLGVREDHYRFAESVVNRSPADEALQDEGLPFGDTASVAAFLRMSKALKEIGILGQLLHGLLSLTTSFALVGLQTWTA